MKTIVKSSKRNRTYMHESIEDRFWRKVGKTTDGCWLWNGSKDCRGYGQIRANGKHGALLKAHRVAWAITNGAIPNGMNVLHKCDNPPCVRPDHLFIGTLSDNSRDAARKGRLVFQQHPERCPRGERASAAKLTSQSVAEVKRLRVEGWTQMRIAQRFGVTQAPIWCVLNGRTWRSEKPTAPNREPREPYCTRLATDVIETIKLQPNQAAFIEVLVRRVMRRSK